jgi:nuclear transport factor 2 (NTF2) superfamily protein
MVVSKFPAEDCVEHADPDRVILVDTEDTRWRNRVEFPVGREEVATIRG